MLDDVRAVARQFADGRRERQSRRHLDPADFDLLGEAGLRSAPLPTDRGGLWKDVPSSVRPICELHRALAAGDPSVALVASMHPAVLAFWLAVTDADTDEWRRQRDTVLDTVEDGDWWGTITSEPGSGGDVTVSRTVAEPAADGGWRITGAKHFGSGSGISSWMLTTALPAGEEMPDWFYLPVRGAPWDGSTGMTMVAEWDGHGMQATQSHAFAFDAFPARRMAWPGHLLDVIQAAGPFVGTLFTAVVLGVLETATETARAQLEPKLDTLRPYERIEWAEAQRETWLAQQAYEGAVRAVESGTPARLSVLRAKTSVALLAESAVSRICRVIGGGTFNRGSPFGHWYEDVRALGFLRPPWGLAYDGLLAPP